MTPAAIKAALDGVVAASKAALAVPVPAGAGLPADLAGRLARAGALLSPTGSLAFTVVTVTHDAQRATVAGRTSAFGLHDLVAELSLGPGDACSLTVSLAAGTTGRLHAGLSWTSLAVGLTAGDGDADFAGALAGVLSVAGRQVPVTLGRFDHGPPAVWTLHTGTGAGTGVSLADLTGIGSDALADLATHLPAIATVARGATELALVTSGDDPRLALTIPFAETLTVVPGALTLSTATLTPMVRFAVEPELPPVAAVEVAGAITALGVSQPGSVRLTPTADGTELRVALTPGATSLLTVAGLCRALLGRYPDDVLAAFPKGLRTHMASSGFTNLEVTVGPLAGSLTVAGSGTFLGWPAHGRLRARPWLGTTFVGFDLLLDEDATTIGAIVDGLGVVIPAALRRHLPTVALALRELRYEPADATFDLGGAFAGTGWELDLRVGLGAGSRVSFEAGRLYGPGAGKALPTLTQLLGSLLPLAPHDDLLSAVEAAVPPALHTLITTTTVRHAGVSWSPGTATTPSALSIDLIVAVATSRGPLTATVALSLIGAVAGTDASWQVQLTTPFLHADIVELARMFGLPDGALGVAPGQLELSLQAIDIGSDGVDVSFELDVGGTPAAMRALVRRSGTAWDWAFQLTVGDLRFDLEVRTGPTSFRARLIAGDAGLRVADIAALLGIDDVPDVLDLALEQVEIRFVPAPSGVGLSATITGPRVKVTTELATSQLARTPPVRAWVMAAAMPKAHLGLDGIPVLGRLIPNPSAFAIDVDALTLSYSNLDLTAGELAVVTSLLAGAPLAPPGKGLGRGLTLGGTLTIGGTVVSIDPGAPEPLPGVAAGAPAPAPGAPPPAGAPSPLKWKSVGASLGPVHIATVGVGYAAGHVLLGITGSRTSR